MFKVQKVCTVKKKQQYKMFLFVLTFKNVFENCLTRIFFHAYSLTYENMTVTLNFTHK